jgi:hypothetical protein
LLSTAHPGGQPDGCLLIAPRFIDGGRIAGGEEAEVGSATFRNLRQNPKASMLVLDPIMDPRARDGVRIECEFLGAEADGAELDKLTHWLETFAPRRKVVRRLIFKVLSVEPFRPPPEGPVVLQ